MIHSLINDYLIRLKNASLAEKAEVVSPFSNHIKDVAGLLQKYGFIKEFKVEENKIITGSYGFILLIGVYCTSKLPFNRISCDEAPIIIEKLPGSTVN